MIAGGHEVTVMTSEIRNNLLLGDPNSLLAGIVSRRRSCGHKRIPLRYFNKSRLCTYHAVRSVLLAPRKLYNYSFFTPTAAGNNSLRYKIIASDSDLLVRV